MSTNRFRRFQNNRMIIPMIVYITVTIFLNCNTSHDYKNVIISDIPNFWNAYDKIVSTEDSILQYKYLDSLYLKKGTKGLEGIRRARSYTSKDYVNSINSYPKFWNSIRENTLKVTDIRSELEVGIEKLRGIYPDLKPAKIYFTIGAFRTGGTTIDGMVLIGSEISMADSSTETSEFSEDLAHLSGHFATNPNKHLVFLNVHEYVHTQQKERVHNLLSLAIYEGVAEFVASKALNSQSPNPQIEFGKKNAFKIREVFEKEMFYLNNLYKWLDGNAPNMFGMRDLGYYIGYQICANYYEQATNKNKAIKSMIELDYTNEKAFEDFIDKSNYFSAPIDLLYETFESNRPTVTGIRQFKNKSEEVNPRLNEITVEFSYPLNGHNTGIDFGSLGENAFPKGTNNGRRWSTDNKSWTMPVKLEPNKKYQILISDNFRTAESIPLKPFLIEFKTSSQ